MKYIITGASGFVGKMIVRILAERGHTIVVIGRSREKLEQLFPEHIVGTYDELTQIGRASDMLVHLATVNSGSTVPEAEALSVNVDLLVETVEKVKEAGVTRFINVSSIHAIDPHNQSIYARSKRAGIAALKKIEGIEISTLYMPAIYGDSWAGKLSVLNRVPALLRGPIFIGISSFKPTCSVDKLVDYLDQSTRGGGVIYDDKEQNPVYRFISRLVDVAFAVVVVLLFWWLLAIIWLLVASGSKGGGLFAQTRIGRAEKPFTCYKFRTMRQGTKQAGTHEVEKAATTKVGAFLRRTKLDELPQVINILRNDMSLVGPRPCLPNQLEVIAARRDKGVFALKPGITGLAQINDSDMSDPNRLAEWDQRYAALRCVTLDLKIMIATVLGKGRGDRVAK